MWPKYRSPAHLWFSLGLVLASVAYTYLASWGFDEGFLPLGAKWSNLDWHLSCGAVFALPVLFVLQLDLRRQFGEALGILLICAATNPIAIFGPGLFLSYIPPWWLTGALAAAFLSVVIGLICRQGPPPAAQFLCAGIAGAVGGYFFILAREHAHYRGCASGEVCVPVEWVLPGYLIWQGGFVASLLLYPATTGGDAPAAGFDNAPEK